MEMLHSIRAYLTWYRNLVLELTLHLKAFLLKQSHPAFFTL